MATTIGPASLTPPSASSVALRRRAGTRTSFSVSTALTSCPAHMGTPLVAPRVGATATSLGGRRRGTMAAVVAVLGARS